MCMSPSQTVISYFQGVGVFPCCCKNNEVSNDIFKDTFIVADIFLDYNPLHTNPCIPVFISPPVCVYTCIVILPIML